MRPKAPAMENSSEVTRSGRVRKKSSKLLSIERDAASEKSAHDSARSRSKSTDGKTPKNKSASIDKTISSTSKFGDHGSSKGHEDNTLSKQTVPKLRIKLGNVPSLAPSSEAATKGVKRPAEAPVDLPKSKKQKRTVNKECKVKMKVKNLKKKEKVKGRKKSIAHVDEDSDEKNLEIDESVEDLADSVQLPRDVHIELPEDDKPFDYGDYGLFQESSTADIPRSDDPKEQKSPDPTEKAKRQRKLPAKLKDDYVDTSSKYNKAAKFFRTKKAESKAAVAIAKHEASKSGKLVNKLKKNRLPTAYTMWCNSYRSKLQAQSPGMDFSTMNKKLGEIWWSIPLKEKNLWKRKAKRSCSQGTSGKSVDSNKYVGSKGVAAIKKKIESDADSSSSKAKSPWTSSLSITLPQNKSFSQTKPSAHYNYKITQTEPVDVAAHLELMSDSLTAIGKGLQNSANAKVQGTISILLDTLLCGISSLLCLTQQVLELDGDTDPETHRKRMVDIAHFIPDI